jgi:hypothetical protein
MYSWGGICQILFCDVKLRQMGYPFSFLFLTNYIDNKKFDRGSA